MGVKKRVEKNSQTKKKKKSPSSQPSGRREDPLRRVPTKDSVSGKMVLGEGGGKGPFHVLRRPVGREGGGIGEKRALKHKILAGRGEKRGGLDQVRLTQSNKDGTGGKTPGKTLPRPEQNKL